MSEIDPYTQPEIIVNLDPGPSGYACSSIVVDGKILPVRAFSLEFPQGDLPVLKLEIHGWRCKFNLLEPSPPPQILTHCPACGVELKGEFPVKEPE